MDGQLANCCCANFAACDLCRRAFGDRGMMRRLVLWAFVFFVFVQCGGWVSVSAAGPLSRSKAAAESKQLGPRLARLYFLREKGLWATEAGIKINGQSAGSVSKGFYFSVEKPPGRYRITCVNPVSADYEAEVQIEGGQTYYFGIGTPQTGASGQTFSIRLFPAVAGGNCHRRLRSCQAFPVLPFIKSTPQKGLPSSIS